MRLASFQWSPSVRQYFLVSLCNIYSAFVKEYEHETYHFLKQQEKPSKSWWSDQVLFLSFPRWDGSIKSSTEGGDISEHFWCPVILKATPKKKKTIFQAFSYLRKQNSFLSAYYRWGILLNFTLTWYTMWESIFKLPKPMAVVRPLWEAKC